MRSSLSLLLAIIAVLLLSCTSKTFDIADASINRKVEGVVSVDGLLLSRSETVRLSVRISDEDSSEYTFRLTSPDGDLSWEGAISNAYRPALVLTPGAAFSSGVYSLSITSESGNSVSAELPLSVDIDIDDIPHFNSDCIFTSRASSEILCEQFNENGETLYSGPVKEGDRLEIGTHHSAISFFDRYGNEVYIEQYFV